MLIINVISSCTKNGSHNFKYSYQQIQDSRKYQIDLNNPNFKGRQVIRS